MNETKNPSQLNFSAILNFIKTANLEQLERLEDAVEDAKNQAELLEKMTQAHDAILQLSWYAKILLTIPKDKCNSFIQLLAAVRDNPYSDEQVAEIRLPVKRESWGLDEDGNVTITFDGHEI